MDPFSITIGAVTLIGAVATTRKTLKKLVSLRKAPEELLQLVNEVSDFHLTIAKIDTIIESLPANDPLSSSLQSFKNRAEAPVTRLQHLLEDHIIENYGQFNFQNRNNIDFSVRSWTKRQDEVRRLKLQIMEVRSKIEHVLVVNSASILPRFHSRLTDIGVENRQMHTLIQSLLTTMQNEKRVSIADPSLVSHGTTSQGIQAEASAIILTGNSSSSETELLLTLQDSRGNMRSSDILQLTTELSTSNRCSAPVCLCRCHLVQQVQPLKWASAVVGSLFVGYSGLPLPLGPKVLCDQRGCQRNEERLVKVAWYFPSWYPTSWNMMSIISRWTPLEGHDLSIKLPRVVPSSAEIFLMAQKGSIEGIQQLISQKRASVYDVSDGEGRTALHFALTADQPEVAAFLIRESATVSFKDHNFLSPVDLVWNYLLESPTKPVYVTFKQVFQHVIDENDDLQKRNFTPLHLVVFGLSSVSLNAILQLSTAEINKKCSLGRTALCWAALREDPEPVRILVSKGASLSIADNRGQNAFHFAAETGSIKSLQSLLEAASNMPVSAIPTPQKLLASILGTQKLEETVSDVNAFCRYMIETKDYKGRTPLHFATRTGQFEHAQLLVWYNADVDSTDSVLNRTPLLLAIYWNRHRITKLLLDAGARTDVADKNGMTVLHYAAKFGDAQTLAVLDEASRFDINANVEDMAGLTALDIFRQIRNGIVKESEQTFSISKERFTCLLTKCKKPDVDEGA